MQTDFADVFETFPAPVLVCRADSDMTVARLNTAARRLFASDSARHDADSAGAPLRGILRIRPEATADKMRRQLQDSGTLDDFPATFPSAGGDDVGARLFANTVVAAGQSFFAIHLIDPVRLRPSPDTNILPHPGREFFRTIINNLHELVYISDPDTYALKFVSKSLARTVGKSVGEMLGRPCWSQLHNSRTGPCSFCPLSWIRERGVGENFVWELNNPHSKKWYMVKDCMIDWVDGERAHLAMLVDITYRKQYEEQLRHFASTDAVTEALNRKWGHARLEELFRASPEERRRQTLCFIDIDNLKKVNDTLGHAAGDEVIVNTAKIISACIRKGDFITRWGGDEFLLLLNCRTEDAPGVLAKVRFGMEHFNRVEGKGYRLSVSAGFVGFGEAFENLDKLIDEADSRMYADKMERRANGELETSLQVQPEDCS